MPATASQEQGLCTCFAEAWCQDPSRPHHALCFLALGHVRHSRGEIYQGHRLGTGHIVLNWGLRDSGRCGFSLAIPQEHVSLQQLLINTQPCSPPPAILLLLGPSTRCPLGRMLSFRHPPPSLGGDVVALAPRPSSPSDLCSGH